MDDNYLLPLPIDVVSIQSQVVYGSVGNNVAVPALQAAGLSVAVIPTVVFSNTPHYPTLHGGPIPINWFEGYLSDLNARDALRALRAVVVGYLGSPAQAIAVAQWLTTLRRHQPRVLVVIDPVIGDHDSGIYVDPLLAQAYRDHLLALADGLTPNGFELASLTGMADDTPQQTVAAARSLLRGHTRWVVVTSATPSAWAESMMELAIVKADTVERIAHARVAASPKGTGDYFCASLVAGLLKQLSVLEAARAASDRVVAALTATKDQRSRELILPRMAPG